VAFEDFISDNKVNYIFVFPLGQIGELANKLSDEFKLKYSDIPWRWVISVRHRIVHDYEGISMGRIWQTIQESIPELFDYTMKILGEIE